MFHYCYVCGESVGDAIAEFNVSVITNTTLPLSEKLNIDGRAPFDDAIAGITPQPVADYADGIYWPEDDQLNGYPFLCLKDAFTWLQVEIKSYAEFATGEREITNAEYPWA